MDVGIVLECYMAWLNLKAGGYQPSSMVLGNKKKKPTKKTP